MSHLNSSTSKPNSVDFSNIVALNLPLNGVHLIEASAGTGKTWTLSVYMVRLIIEQKYQTRQIIVTTFTRAAAAELKQRIREDFEKTKQWLLTQNKQHQDPLAQYIFSALTSDQQAHAVNLLQLALDTFDELFVGTLDSFCQKMLHEFAFDSGQYERLQISEQENELRYQILHDALRQWRTQQDPRLIELMVLNNSLLDVDDFENLAKTSLNFLSADIEPVPAVSINWQQWADFAQQLERVNIAEMGDYLHPSGIYFKGLNAKKRFYSKAAAYPSAIDQIKAQLLERNGLLALSDDHQKWFEGFADIEAHFKKGFETAKTQFINLAAVQLLANIYQAINQLHTDIDNINRHLKYHLSQTLRQQLSPQLIERGETTFAQQMRLLGDALQGESGQVLAQHMVHRYPVIMVDEFQDTNADQDRVIASVWRKAELVQQISLVLVGDPKQAIYGFRGGDMLTYQQAKTEVLKIGKQHHLTFNQRSIAGLVRAVDRLFCFNRDFGEKVQYDEVTASGRNTRQLVQADHINQQPFRLLALQEKQDEYQQIAWQIIDLLKQSHAGQLYFVDGSPEGPYDHQQKSAVQPQDIAVLCASNAELEKVHYFLNKASVPVWRGAETSVFESMLAQDVAAILQAMLSPQHEGYLRRALASQLVGFTVSDFNRIDEQNDLLSQSQAKFADLAGVWLKRGFLSAWQQFLSQFNVWQTLSMQPNSERNIVNLRHLIELIHQHSEKITGQHHLLAWLMTQISQPQRHERELERRLASQQGVQLMTIHKSKGLEFPIVFVGGLDKVKKLKTEVIFSEKDQRRVLSFDDKATAQVAEHQLRHDAEQRRLVYVALTRASIRLYVSIKPNDDDKASKNLIRYWLHMPRDAWQDHNTQVQPTLIEQPTFIYEADTQQQVIAAQALPQIQIKQWLRTSFSQMMKHDQTSTVLSDHDQDVVLLADDADHKHDDEATEPTVDQPAQDMTMGEVVPLEMRFRFPRGANAGDCLHQILEYLPLDQDDEHWLACIEKQVQRFGIDQAYQKYYPDQPLSRDEVMQWMQQIHLATLPHGARLMNLTQQVHEFEFYLGLQEADLNVVAIQQILLQYGIEISALNVMRSVKYLKGFIDLVYAHEGKYYIADYKSNYLGDADEDYVESALKDSMSRAGYWLQAAIYLVALHRYLTARLGQHYQPEQHLGGAVYLYLRGMQAQSDQTGILFWQADIELILALDQIFGYDNAARQSVYQA
jgi:exodeoxyribonuclease V beta subunit